VQRVLGVPVRTPKPGRPRGVLAPSVLLAPLIKHAQKRRVVGVTQRVVLGTGQASARVLAATHRGRQINTAYSARLNATFRACLVPVTRRGRRLVRDGAVLHAGMFLLGTAYNVCGGHRSLRVRAGRGGPWVPGRSARPPGPPG
jgi:hypothetical protein